MIRAYYNEHDPKAAAWLRELIKQGHIAPGDVDERSIEDVIPSELTGYTQCHFFAGAGVWSHALRQAGWSDSKKAWTGSCPCQPFSAAGKGEGFADERHLWPAFYHLISQCRPDVVFGEQVASGRGLAWLDLVYSDMEAAGYAVGTLDLPGACVGAPIIRQRIFFLACAFGKQDHAVTKRRLHAELSTGGIVGKVNGFWSDAEWVWCIDGKYRPIEPGTFPLVNGTAARMGRLRGYGNAIVAPVAEAFIRAYL